MTEYEKIVAGGPLALATLITESKIRAITKSFNKLGLDYELEDGLKQNMIDMHLKMLNRECTEVSE